MSKVNGERNIIMNKLTGRKDMLLRAAALAAFSALVLMMSWNSDDAYHSFIMAKHLAEGDGLVYNIGYRVSASTCPLFTLCEAALYWLFPHMLIDGILIGVIFSTAAGWVVAFKLCKDAKQALIALGILGGSYCFFCYTTSGLENSLLYFLAVLFVWIYTRKERFREKDLFLLSLTLALIAWTRMDNVLIFVPVICYGYLVKTDVKFIKRILIGIAGLLPFIGWLLFSLFYYGYPFPNTYYIKVATGFPTIEYIKHGFDFLYRSYSSDILLLLIPLIFITLSIIKKNKDMIALSIGIILYTVYVIYVGGDFMIGRHLTVQYIVSVAGILVLVNAEMSRSSIWYKAALTTLVIGLVWSSQVGSYAIERLAYTGSYPDEYTSVADEKKWYYFRNGGLLYLLDRYNKTGENVSAQQDIQAIADAYYAGDAGIYSDGSFFSGREVYYAADYQMYITDRFGLQDPLLSHLPAEYTDTWRVGHMWRATPEGYAESVRTGTNCIENPDLHEFYDKVLLIIHGDLFDAERIQTIIKMNLGEYDYLIDNYLKTQ